MKSLAGEFGCPTNDLQQYLFLFHNRKSSLCLENEMIFSHRCLVFCRSSWFLSKLKAGLLTRQESQMAKRIPISSTLTEGSQVFWKNSSCGHPKVQQTKLFDMIGQFLSNLCDKNKIWSSANHAKVQSFGGPISYSKIFESNTEPKLRTVDLVGIANSINEILQVFHFCSPVFVHHRAFSRY